MVGFQHNEQFKAVVKWNKIIFGIKNKSSSAQPIGLKSNRKMMECRGGPVVPTYEQVMGSNSTRRITQCNLYHHHFFQNGEGKKPKQTNMYENQNFKDMCNLPTYMGPRGGFQPAPPDIEDACVPVVRTLQIYGTLYNISTAQLVYNID